MHFVNWLAQYDITLERHIKMAPKNATYLFPQIQDEIISCIGDNIHQNILSDVSKSPFSAFWAAKLHMQAQLNS